MVIVRVGGRFFSFGTSISGIAAAAVKIPVTARAPGVSFQTRMLTIIGMAWARFMVVAVLPTPAVLMQYSSRKKTVPKIAPRKTPTAMTAVFGGTGLIRAQAKKTMAANERQASLDLLCR